MPSGEIRRIQGYENFALDELIKIYSEDNIKTGKKNIPRVKINTSLKDEYSCAICGVSIEGMTPAALTLIAAHAKRLQQQTGRAA